MRKSNNESPGDTEVTDGPVTSAVARPKLFQPLTIRGLTLRNRLVVPPTVHGDVRVAFIDDPEGNSIELIERHEAAGAG